MSQHFFAPRALLATLVGLLCVPVAAARAPAPEAARSVIAQADELVRRRQYAQARALLVEQRGAAAALVRARAARGLGASEEANEALVLAAKEPSLAELVAVEQGLLALAALDPKAAAVALLPLVRSGEPAVAPVVLGLAEALAPAEPKQLLANYEALEALRERNDPDARSRLLAAKALALRALTREAEAKAIDKSRYLEEPVSLLTPAQPPAGLTLSADEQLARIETLLAANRNERVVAALDALPEASLSPAQRCQKHLGRGLALRKLREYASAEAELTLASELCPMDEERQRRARYLNAKVVSIRDGLRAVPLIEAFATSYADSSMADDVLFWAGDLYQRRGKRSEAETYYERVHKLATPDDQCGEALWRLGWMSYRQGDTALARTRLAALLKADKCKLTGFDRARANYWLGRIAQTEGARALAETHYRRAFDEQALGFYAQLALVRLAEVAKTTTQALSRPPPAPAPAARPATDACARQLPGPGYTRARRYLEQGLKSDAGRELLALPTVETRVLSSTHASALGLDAKPVAHQALASGADAATCSERDVKLALALLLDEAGEYKEAHWRLRTDFAAELDSMPTTANVHLWRAAYPLAWRAELQAAEQESKLPELFLQALAREESAFDPLVVSWAGAYGLTQLLFSTGRDAGRLLNSPVTLARAEDLLDPTLNARLGGAMLAAFVRRFGGNPALALAAYNAGGDAAAVWWKRHQADGFDVLAEEITIQETRGYVKRVLRTFGVYRWLYGGDAPKLAIGLSLPPLP